MNVVYIAGPFRAETAWKVEQNIRRAEEVALQVWKLGAAVICPHTNTRFFDGEAPDTLWLEGALEMLRRCDVVMCLEGWESSRGACAEVEAAIQLKIPVYSHHTDLKRFLDDAALAASSATRGAS